MYSQPTFGKKKKKKKTEFTTTEEDQDFSALLCRPRKERKLKERKIRNFKQ